ncbi:hypothetical protein BH20ACT24_BH20ACT24_03970 [soil metagenome]
MITQTSGSKLRTPARQGRGVTIDWPVPDTLPVREVDAIDWIAPGLDAVITAWQERRERLTLALIAVPLAETASGLSGLWWAWPALLAGAWACTRTWHWTWLLSLELGAVGAMWATVGADVLARSSGNLLVVGAAWAALPLALAATGLRNRHRHSKPGTTPVKPS